MSQVILITGCSTGIGLETALLLATKGYRVLATARKPEQVTNLQERGLESCVLDLDHSESIIKAATWASARTGGLIDAVFHNGAYGQAGALEDLSRQALREQFETNLFGWHELNNLLLPLMRKQGHGKIIFNSSVLGLVCMPYRGAYNASKFAVEAYADTLRLELHQTGIHISLIEPGPIRSRFRDNAHASFQRFVDRKGSPHQAAYDAMEERLKMAGDSSTFTLGPEAVASKVLAIMETERPKNRYYVTLPTYVCAYLKRLLPSSIVDTLMRKG